MSKDSSDLKDVIYRLKSATQDDICSHLVACNEGFIPALDQRVNIRQYAIKLFQSAETFEAWVGGKLVGLVAAYFNNLETRSGYVTTVSVMKEFKGMGISTELLKACITYAGTHNFRDIRLEVHKENLPAIQLYRKLGFRNDGVRGDFLWMKLDNVS